MRVNANTVLRSWTLLAAFGGSYAPDNIYTHVRIHVPIRIHNYAWCIWATVYQSQHEVKTITVTVCQAFIMNSDERGSQTSQKKRASGC